MSAIITRSHLFREAALEAYDWCAAHLPAGTWCVDDAGAGMVGIDRNRLEKSVKADVEYGGKSFREDGYMVSVYNTAPEALAAFFKLRFVPI